MQLAAMKFINYANLKSVKTVGPAIRFVRIYGL